VSVTKEIKRLDKSNVSLSITIPKEDIRLKYDNMLKEYTKTLQIPGFRKGKAPKEVLERKFADALKGEVLGRIIESALEEVFQENNLPRNEKPLSYSTPVLQEEDIKLDFEQDFKFSVIYDVLPEVKIGQWKGIKAEYPYAEVGKEELDKELEEIRDRNSFVIDLDDNAKAQKGFVATVNYQVYNENGEESDLKRDDFTFTIGSGSHYVNFDDDVTGMKKGETKEFDKKFADDYFDKALAGKTRKVKISLTALKEKKLPDLDDDLAQDVDSKFNTLEDLKNNIKERLNKNLEMRIKEKKLNILLSKIKENTPVILPESMVRAEIEGRFQRIAHYYNTSVEAIMQMTSEDKMNEMREASEKALHSRFIIETLIEEQKIEVSDEDIKNEIEQAAAANNTEVEEIKKYYDSEQTMAYLKEDIKERKIVDIMFAENNLKPGKKENYLAFMTDNG
jgi:trigger factor